eukprot:scaffold12240_cov77-Attheya_sp.AAC.2
MGSYQRDSLGGPPRPPLQTSDHENGASRWLARATNDEQSADVFESHLTKVFNRDDAPVDFTVLDMIDQRSTKTHLDHPPTYKEIEKHIQKAAKNKAGAFWYGESDYKEWREAILKWLPKKGNLLQANNWREICLGNALAKIYSSILTERLYKVMKVEGIENQFRSQPPLRGCQGRLFMIRTILELRRNHNLPTWALFSEIF